MSEHTPGPWQIYEDGVIGSASVRRFPEMTVLQPGTVRGETIGVAMANARLIAAAPALLAACEAVLEHWGAERPFTGMAAWCEVIDRVEAAIAAARGKETTQ